MSSIRRSSGVTLRGMRGIYRTGVVVGGGGGSPQVEPGDAPAITPTTNVSALAFTGTHTIFPVGIPAEITGNLTIEACFRATSIGSARVIVEKPHTSHVDPYYIYGLYLNATNAIRFDITIAGTRYNITSPSGIIAANDWYHVAGTYDGTTATLYVNGVLMASLAVSGAITSNGSTPLYVGSHGNITIERLIGQIDEVRLWSVARSQLDIIRYMDRSLSSGSGLVGCWHFDENTGSTTADATGGLADASLTTGVTFYTTTQPYEGGALSQSYLPSIYRQVQMPSYVGDGQIIHPSVIRIPGGAGVGTKVYWMAMTPYSGGDNQYENPSILSSDDGLNWAVPLGLTNPVVAKPVGSGDYNLDPELIYHGGEFYLYYNEKAGANITMWLRKSSDGATWAAAIQILQIVYNGSFPSQLSPSVIHDGSQFVMFYIDNGGTTTSKIVRRTSADGETWSSASDMATSGLPGSTYHWHIEVAINPTDSGRLDMLLGTSTATGGANPRLRYGYSLDGGANWTVGALVVDSSRYFETVGSYRGTWWYDPTDPDIFHIYYTGLKSAEMYTAYLRRELIANELYAPQTIV